jgi:hypothetical protein
VRIISLIIATGVLLVPSAANSEEAVRSNMSKKFAISKEQIRKLVDPMGGAFATDRIMVEGRKITYMYREISDRPEDSGWRFFAGDEDQAYIDDLHHTGIYAVNTVANYDPDVIPYLNTKAPCAFEKVTGTNRYRLVKQ